MRRSKWRKIQI